MEEQKQSPSQEDVNGRELDPGQSQTQSSPQIQQGGEQGRPSRPNPSTQESQHENRQQLPKQ